MNDSQVAKETKVTEVGVIGLYSYVMSDLSDAFQDVQLTGM